jgi:hypothetical protein
MIHNANPYLKYPTKNICQVFPATVFSLLPVVAKAQASLIFKLVQKTNDAILSSAR